jgi:hypothetical protein
MMKDTAAHLQKSLNDELKTEVERQIKLSVPAVIQQPLVKHSIDAIDEIDIQLFGEYIFTVKSELSPVFLVVTAIILITFIVAFCFMKFEEEQQLSVGRAEDLENPVQDTQRELEDYTDKVI